MSATAEIAPAAAEATSAPARRSDPTWRACAIAGASQLLGLALVLADASIAVAAVAVALAGAVGAAFVLVPLAAGVVRRHPILVAAAVVVVLVVLWLLDSAWFGPRLPLQDAALPGRSAGDGRVVAIVLMLVAGIGGTVLIADATRVRAGRRAAPWSRMTAEAPSSGTRFPWRGVAGVALIGWAALLAFGTAGSYAAGSGLRQLIVVVVIVAVAAIAVGTPLLVAVLTRSDRDHVGAAREDERQRFAAHLHDSVLQTLALVQRQAHDPATVARLARRQEHALRAWMAGEAELLGDTLAAALREVAAGVEDDHGIAIELSIIGDRPLDPVGEAITAATREALRNAARHAGGAPVFVFAELSEVEVEVFVRDEGPGFDLAAVAPERRGLRDAVIGRMAAVGGSATVDAAPDEGTEIALRGGAARAGA